MLTLLTRAVSFSFYFLGSGHDKLAKLAKPAHQKAPEKSLGIKGQSCLMLRWSHKGMRYRT